MLWVFFIQGERNDVDHIFGSFDLMISYCSRQWSRIRHCWNGFLSTPIPDTKVMKKKMNFRAQLNGVKAIDNLSCKFPEEILPSSGFELGAIKMPSTTHHHIKIIELLRFVLVTIVEYTKNSIFKSNVKTKRPKKT